MEVGVNSVYLPTYLLNSVRKYLLSKSSNVEIGKYLG